METQKIIFLDFEGVMLTDHGWDASPERWFDGQMRPFAPQSVQALNWLTQRTGAGVVLTSTWRRMFPGLAQFARMFAHFGLSRGPVGKTPLLGQRREGEIAQYLHENPVSAYVVLDDMRLALPEDRFVWIDQRHGLTLKDAQRAAELLEGFKPPV